MKQETRDRISTGVRRSNARKRLRKLPKPLVLRPVHPNAGIRAAYRKRLLALVDEMTASYRFWIEQAYERVPPAIAQDEPYGSKRRGRSKLSSKELERELKKLARRWEERFADAAPRLAGWFMKAVDKRSYDALMHILRKGGFTVGLDVTPALRDVIQASTIENVSLIKSIPEQFHTQVEGLVMRSVTAGRDLAPLTDELQRQFGVTRRRAELIAFDQNQKASAAITRARHLDIGLETGIWVHSAGGKKRRPTHVANSGKEFSIRDGWADPALGGKRIWPGTEIRCRCICRPVVKGFS